jgi:hypothetical protein
MSIVPWASPPCFWSRLWATWVKRGGSVWFPTYGAFSQGAPRAGHSANAANELGANLTREHLMKVCRLDLSLVSPSTRPRAQAEILPKSPSARIPSEGSRCALSRGLNARAADFGT